MDGRNLCTAELELCLTVRAAPLLLACRKSPMSFMPWAGTSHAVNVESVLHMCAAMGSLQV